ncbi:MAG: GTP cyclohydrolase [Campylobacteraceae bacterium]|nr:GTP cyclohydrolase [Campylobacteraceae bacterium]
MFIISITYSCPLEEVVKFLDRHVTYLKEQYSLGHFIASGRKVPRSGGIILSQMDSLEKLEKVLELDPFKINALAQYEIQEFIPSMSSKEFENLIEE